MARWTVAAMVALFVMGSSPANSGELRNAASLLSGMAGYSTHKSQQSGDQIGGGSWSFEYARVDRGGNWSAGFVLRRFESDEYFDDADSGEQIRANAKRLVAAVEGKLYFLENWFDPYVGGLAGVHMQTTDVGVTGDEDYRQSSQTLALGLSVGSNFHVTDGMFLRAEYSFEYFSGSDTIKNNHMHVFYGGLGFQFGGF